MLWEGRFKQKDVYFRIVNKFCLSLVTNSMKHWAERNSFRINRVSVLPSVSPFAHPRLMALLSDVPAYSPGLWEVPPWPPCFRLWVSPPAPASPLPSWVLLPSLLFHSRVPSISLCNLPTDFIYCLSPPAHVSTPCEETRLPPPPTFYYKNS